jgi:hypothetical protein
MKFYKLTWDPHACGIPATYFTLYHSREVIDREGNQLSDYTAEEVIQEAVNGWGYVFDTEHYVTIFGKGNTFAVVAHNGTDKSAPQIIAKNLGDSATVVLENGEYIFKYEDNTENGGS